MWHNERRFNFKLLCLSLKKTLKLISQFQLIKKLDQKSIIEYSYPSYNSIDS